MNLIYTIGHSNQPIESFLDLLKEFGIRALADIRHFPGSRRHPWFSQDPLRQAVEAVGIEYHWFEDLGGFRRSAAADSPNSGLRHPAFRAYADYMQTPEFQVAAERLMRLAEAKTTAYMCAELLYWHCHRMLLSDYFTANGWQVIHILGHEKTKVHAVTAGAVVEAGQLAYPPVEGELFP